MRSFSPSTRWSALVLLCSVVSAAAQGTGAPAITSQPQSQSVVTGTNVSFMVSGTGTAPLFYQWLRNGTAVLQATNDSFTITNVQIFDAGGYTVIVSNSVGSVTSVVARLTVDRIWSSASSP